MCYRVNVIKVYKCWKDEIKKFIKKRLDLFIFFVLTRLMLSA